MKVHERGVCWDTLLGPFVLRLRSRPDGRATATVVSYGEATHPG